MSKIESLQRNAADTKQRNAIKKRLSQKTARTLFKELNNAVVEKDVENAWRKVFSEYYVDKGSKEDNYVITSPYNVDGFISADTGNLVFALRILLEFKNGTNLTKQFDRARILCQCIHYMKAFQDDGAPLPTIIVGADEDQAFVLIAKKFYKYLDKDYNWDIAPSEAYKKDTKLLEDLMQDANLSIYPFQFVGGTFEQRYNSLLDLFESIDSISENDTATYKVKVSPSTIVGMFDEFNHLAFREPKKVKPVAAVNMFMQMLTGKNEDDYYFIPRNHNEYHLPGDKKISVYGSKIEAFLNHYDRNFPQKQIDLLTSIADRLIEVNERRFKGDFWTPDIWSRRADEILQESLGEDYKDKSLVWDCAAGVRNLTRQFRYSDLYISTYHEDEIKLGDGYNPEVKAAFQYDFLNDDVELTPDKNPNPEEWKMPNNLFNALLEAGKTGKRVVFYTNPPYATAGVNGAKGTSKKNVSKSLMNKYMHANDYGRTSEQLYCQFFARILKLKRDFHLTNVVIGFFSPCKFFTGGTFKKFDHNLFSEFEFQKGVLLNAGEFSDTSDVWPITFSVYQSKSDVESNNKKAFSFPLEKSQYDGVKESIRVFGKHTLTPVFDTDNQSLRKWAKSKLTGSYKEMKEFYPELSSAMNESTGSKRDGKLFENSLGYIMNSANNVGEGTVNGGVWIGTSAAYHAHGFNIMPENFDSAVVNFAARRSVTPTWYNHVDNYRKPNENSPIYPEYINDALVFSLFENASNQAAYRHEGWSNTGIANKWANQWFWISRDKVIDTIEDDPKYNSMMKDINADDDRFVAKEIAKRKFSPEAQKVLDLATKVWKKTLPLRPLLSDDHPELYLNAWDAGWYQIKQIIKGNPIDEYKEFKQAFIELKAKLEENTYQLGMLDKPTIFDDK